ncbi:MAG: hypothetical protein KF752_09805 [Pirellulaceae bacterium]|nr:hypothetical protein [Pirellulaceae bacterium]
MAEVNGPLLFGQRFINRQTGNASALGLIDEVSAVTDGSLGNADDELFVRIPLRATAVGTLNVSTNPADILPAHEVSLNGLDSPISQQQITYGSTQLEIQPSNKWHNKRLQEDVNGDGQVSPIDALRIINFINRHGSRSVLSAPDVDAFFDGGLLDVNNDDSITALDVLLVINRLNAG